MNITDYAKISKSGIRSIIGPMMQFYDGKKETNIIIHTKHCKEQNCSYYSELLQIEQSLTKEEDSIKIKDLIQKKHSIYENCKNCKNCIEKTEYKNEQKKYALYQKKYAFRRLPKISMKLYLLLHFCPMLRLGSFSNPYYVIYNINVIDLAEKINCTVTSIKKSLQLLESFYYLTATPGCRDNCYNIHISDYELTFRPAEEGGSGYLTLNQEILNYLLEQTNVNQLRGLCYKLLREDDLTQDDRENQTVEIPIKDIKSVLPNHINYMQKFKNYFSDTKLFHTVFENKKCYFTLKNTFHLKRDIKEYVQTFKQKLLKLSQDTYTFLSSKDVQDIAKMAPQYGLQPLLESIDLIKQNYIDKCIPIHSIGALTRRICERRFVLHFA